jgi:hypothetical protein
MRTLVLCLFLAAAAPLAAADPFEDNYRGQGFLQFGVGGCSIGAHDWFRTGCGVVGNIAAGGEAFVYRGLAVGGEGGWGWINDHFDEGIGVVSINPAWHFRGSGPRRPLVPFVSGGYTLLVRGAQISGFNVGGGATWWPGRHLGLRFEGRVHHFSAGPLGANVFLFRFGPSFR